MNYLWIFNRLIRTTCDAYVTEPNLSHILPISDQYFGTKNVLSYHTKPTWSLILQSVVMSL